jgi:hypothetical protein
MRIYTLVAALTLLSLACASEHLSPSFGRANHDAYAMQRGTKARPAPNMALDTQEAEVISGSYLASLAPEKANDKPEPVLIVAPPRPGPTQPLAPSVPTKQ